MSTMSFRIKAILINCGIAAALVYRYKTGTPLSVVAIVGVLVFVFANVLMIIASRQQPKKK
jgi:uncharacterized membrane protein